ncbi:hypothetical protein [Embleya scabrispora]|uniref:hypothetical protein n=1 Tax=Embleya scabrispora TaxID=159449 RepID=UPI0003782751|nr:hypothetical protein [Embleya scabrispora]MYS82757.1 hypothetical protein [Streptomyces sp. SID5474]
MSRYYVAYTNRAENDLSGLPSANRAVVKREIENSIGNDAYGCGSSPIRGDKDRRSASVSTVIIEYEVSASVLTVTVIHAQTW